MKNYDVIIIGSGPAALGSAFRILQHSSDKILIIEKNKYSSGGLLNDCKMNFDYRVGFPSDCWDQKTAEYYIDEFKYFIRPNILPKQNLDTYQNRVKHFLGTQLLEIEQTHYGTDGGKELVNKFINVLKLRGVDFLFDTTVQNFAKMVGGYNIVSTCHNIEQEKNTFSCDKLIVAPGRGGFLFAQSMMKELGIKYIDNVIDIGLRIETEKENYQIVNDYYDPKFLFPSDVRTFCTNSGKAFVVQEKNDVGYTVNGHAYSQSSSIHDSELVNFAILKTCRFTEPLASGQDYAQQVIRMAMLAGNNKPIMQRVGDFRLGKRSKEQTFQDFSDFKNTLNATPGDISLVCPSKIMRDIWRSLKILDSIVPGVLHPSTIMYFPEIKFYANKPQFKNDYFAVQKNMCFIGDGFGTSRGIVGAWASGMRAVDGMYL